MGCGGSNKQERGLMMFWRDYVQICQIIKSSFCMEVEFEGEGFDDKCQVVFIYAIEESIRRLLQNYLKYMRSFWRKRWILGGDFNEILKQEDKQGGIRRLESSFIPFRTFIKDIEMGEMCFKGRIWIQANNRQ